MLNTTIFNNTCSIAWSWLSPPGVDITRYGFPSLVTMVGLNVTRGRLPGASSFGCPGVNTNDCSRDENGMPVSPAITDGSQAPLGVAENMFPFRSITFTQVVSFTMPPL